MTNNLFTQVVPEVLKEKEVYLLLEKIRKGDELARQEFIAHNIRLVISRVLGRFKNVAYDKKDLISIGCIGLIKAVDTFDTNKSVKFLQYARVCIDNEILMFLRKLNKINMIDSLDKAIIQDFDGNELTLLDVLDDQSINIQEDYVYDENKAAIRSLVLQLPQFERQIIMLYFGFYNNHEFTQKEISEMLNYSQSYISRVIKKTISILKEQFEKEDDVIKIKSL